MPTVLDWNPTVDPTELVGVIREAILAGSSVVLPSDCGYVALVNPAAPHAVARLAALTAASGTPPAVLAWGPDDPAGLGLPVSTIAHRLMFRAWPAPVTVAIAGKPEWPSEWPAAVRELLTHGDGRVRFRCPEHPLFEAVVPALEVPVLIADTFLPRVEAVLDILEDPTAVAVSVGEHPAEGRPTVVRIEAAGYVIEEAGVFPLDEIEKFAAKIVLFVCTGNTCRSPLAEALAKKVLAERLGCTTDELPGRGFWVISAGVQATHGDPASEDSVTVAAEYGADLTSHESKPLNPQLIAAADDIIAMTRAHALALMSRYPGVEPRLLCGDADLDDPIGAGLGVYRACAQTMHTHLERFLPEWTGS